MTTRLKNNISELYEIFGKYLANPNMEGTSADLNKNNELLFSKPLTELTQDDLSHFAGSSMTTWGNSNDYKHFLPRILDLTAEIKTPYEIWIVFDKLNYAGWNNWPQIEQDVIYEFMIALWESIINEESEISEWDFRDYFSTIAHFYPNFSDLLNIWSESESNASIKHLSELLVEEQTAIFDRRKISGFNDKTENAKEFISWILSDKILNKVQQKYFEFEKESFAEKISWAEQIIMAERKSTAHNITYN
ncbi:hypothetical protein [Flavivirga spongiicola]|uniref:Uncharacterized protein n=1 Tax=Flavivirga spongiicola TaxID=421621 RepID=A0ABU7XMW8_9FLAO|nr:hypothetical protein [Flavivirga sp. MEBiC05379]MDO5981745.1 hypothetical protein [Flavivirga sp. MEBiC05379]